MATSTRRRAGGTASRPSARSGPPHLRFYLYTVEGTLGGRRKSFGVVCCHNTDALAMMVERLPELAAVTVTRGSPVHFIAIGDHLLHE